MSDFKVKDPTEHYADGVNEILDLVEKLNDYESTVTCARVIVELDTTTGRQLHFLEKQYTEGSKFNTSTGFYEQHHPDMFNEFSEIFGKYHDSKFFPQTTKTVE